jgi:outer membrane protein OmpA-like peptidoglycan-associated protein
MEAQEMLKKDLEVLKENPGVTVRIEGHACSHGPEDYNLRLSERRANAVKEYLTKEGIAADRLSTIAYGKTRPLCVDEPTAKNKNDECMKKNRRVHFEVVVH